MNSKIKYLNVLLPAGFETVSFIAILARRSAIWVTYRPSRSYELLYLLQRSALCFWFLAAFGAFTWNNRVTHFMLPCIDVCSIQGRRGCPECHQLKDGRSSTHTSRTTRIVRGRSLQHSGTLLLGTFGTLCHANHMLENTRHGSSVTLGNFGLCFDCF